MSANSTVLILFFPDKKVVLVLPLLILLFKQIINYVLMLMHSSSLHNQKIWALQDGTAVVVGGKTNRAKAEFPDEMNRLLDQLPEIVESSSPK